MLISTSIRPLNNELVRPKATSAPQENVPSDSITFGYNSSKDVALMSVAGATPLLGAATNFLAMVGAGVNGKEELSWMNLAGTGANLAGTLSLAGGLLTGNNTATYVGLGLLTGSGVTAGITTAAL